jgi:hypothetical protein
MSRQSAPTRRPNFTHFRNFRNETHEKTTTTNQKEVLLFWGRGGHPFRVGLSPFTSEAPYRVGLAPFHVRHLLIASAILLFASDPSLTTYG